MKSMQSKPMLLGMNHQFDSKIENPSKMRMMKIQILEIMTVSLQHVQVMKVIQAL